MFTLLGWIFFCKPGESTLKQFHIFQTKYEKAFLSNALKILNRAKITPLVISLTGLEQFFFLPKILTKDLLFVYCDNSATDPLSEDEMSSKIWSNKASWNSWSQLNWKDRRPPAHLPFPHMYKNTCTRTTKWTPNKQACENRTPLDDKTYLLIFPVLTHDLSLTGGKDRRDPWNDSLPFTSMQFTAARSVCQPTDTHQMTRGHGSICAIRTWSQQVWKF